MARLLSKLSSERLGEYFFPVSIAFVIAVLFAVQQLLSLRFVIFGLYGLFGLVGGAAVYYRTNEMPDMLAPTIDERYHSLGLYIVVAVTLGVVSLTGEPLFVVVGLGLGYALVVRQLVSFPSAQSLVPQLTTLFMLSPVVKYLTAGRYFGHGDLLIHARLVEDIVQGGSVSAISFASYFEFPGLHLLATSIASLSGLSPYDGLMLTGLGAYMLVIPAVYIVAQRLTDNTVLALSIAFGTAVLDDLAFYVSYAFPQSIATVLVIVLAVLAVVSERDAVKWSAAGGFTLVALTLAYTHHLTQVLFAPVIATVATIYAVRNPDRIGSVLRSRPAGLLAVAGLISGIRIWMTGTDDRLFRAGTLLVQGGPIGGYTQGVSREFGAAAQPSQTAAAIEWLASPYGVYGILLLMVFSIGVVGLLQSDSVPTGYGAVAWAGALGAAIIFETPLSIQSLIRIRAPWLFVFAFVVGLGIYYFNRNISSTRSNQLLVVLLVVLAAVGPLVAADDYYGLDPRETSESSFSQQQVEELEATSTFLQQTDQQTTTFWQTRLAMDRRGISGIERARLQNEEVILPSGYFVYRTEWPQHRVTFTVGAGEGFYANTLYLSDNWLSDRVGSSNQVYSAGGTGVLWAPTERTLATGAPAPNETAENSTGADAGALIPADESTPTESGLEGEDDTPTETESEDLLVIDEDTPTDTEDEETETEDSTDTPAETEDGTETDSIFESGDDSETDTPTPTDTDSIFVSGDDSESDTPTETATATETAT